MPKFDIVQHPDFPQVVFVTTPDDDLDYEETLKALTMQYHGWLSQQTPTRDGGMIYKFQFRDVPTAKKAMRDFKTAKEFNLV